MGRHLTLCDFFRKLLNVTLIPVRPGWPHCPGPGLTLLEFAHDCQTTLRLFDHGDGEFCARPDRRLHFLLSAVAMSGPHSDENPEDELAQIALEPETSTH